MPQEPLRFFGWLMNCCVSDDRSSLSNRETFSATILFASGMAAGGLTLYLAGLLHLI
jgi:hypothetical protein